MRPLPSRAPYQVELSAEAWRTLGTLTGEDFHGLQETLQAVAATAPLVRWAGPGRAGRPRSDERCLYAGRFDAHVAYDDERRVLLLVRVERARRASLPEGAHA